MRKHGKFFYLFFMIIFVFVAVCLVMRVVIIKFGLDIGRKPTYVYTILKLVGGITRYFSRPESLLKPLMQVHPEPLWQLVIYKNNGGIYFGS